MQKLLIITLMTTFVMANGITYFDACSRDNCSLTMTNCELDTACSQVLTICKNRCEQSKNQNCFQSCMFSSNSSVAQKLTLCANSNNCWNTLIQIDSISEVSCPKSCTEFINAGEESCSSPQAYATWECIVEYLENLGKTQCDDKACVCKTTSSQGIYVAGCYC